MASARTPGDDLRDGDRAGAGRSAGATPSAGPGRAENESPESPNTVMSIPGTHEQAARRVEAVSVEGRPADAKSGPGTLWVELGAASLVIVAGATAVGLWFGLLGGIAAFFLGLLALLVNPEVGAAILRVRDRRAAVERPNSPGQSRDAR